LVATNVNMLGLAGYRNGLWDGVIATLNKSIEMSQGTVPPEFYFLAMAQWRRGDREDAERSFRRGVEGARKDAPSQSEWRRLRAEATEWLGKPGPVPTLFEVKADSDRALDTLRRMSASGFLRPEVLRTSPDLAPLSGRPDFQLLVMDLASPGDPFASGR
jgi:hypothetical protein